MDGSFKIEMTEAEVRILKNQIEIMWTLSYLLKCAKPNLIGKAGELDHMRDDLAAASKETKSTVSSNQRQKAMSKIDEIEKRINDGDNITIEPDGTVRDLTDAEIANREADERRTKEKLAARAARGRKPILCLDFDGVIHSYSSGWKGADIIPDPPVDGAIAFMLSALDHFDVVIFSSRSNQRGGLRAMQAWLREHAGATWYESPAGPGLEDIRFVTEKPSAMVTLDDRALTFDGTWPAIEALKEFKPWNKQ